MQLFPYQGSTDADYPEIHIKIYMRRQNPFLHVMYRTENLKYPVVVCVSGLDDDVIRGGVSQWWWMMTWGRGGWKSHFFWWRNMWTLPYGIHFTDKYFNLAPPLPPSVKKHFIELPGLVLGLLCMNTWEAWWACFAWTNPTNYVYH